MQSSLCISSQMTMSLTLHALLQCELAPPPSPSKSYSSLSLPPSKSVVSPRLESELPYDSFETKRMWQSGSVWHLRLASTQFPWEACSGGHSPSWDHRVERPHTGTQQNPAFLFCPRNAQHVREEPSWKWTLQPSPMSESPSIPVFPVEAQTQEQRLATPDVSCPNCWLKEPAIIIQWFLAPWQ